MKFHANPQLQLESKDLAELSIGEIDARQEVLEFLDHWGLINFHPFPPAGQEESKPEESQDNSHDEEKASLIEKKDVFFFVQGACIRARSRRRLRCRVSSLLGGVDPLLVMW